MKSFNVRVLFAGLCALSLWAALAWMSPRTYAKPAAVLDDQQLMELARDTYQREDWIYAALHMNALVQRNPPSLSSDRALANQINEGLKFSIEKLQEYKTTADSCARRAASTSDGGSVSSGLTRQPPHIDFPH